MKNKLYFFLSALAVMVFSANAIANDFVNKRAIWVTRWDYKTPSDILRIMENAKDVGTNVVLFQIRGNATTFYRSDIEPWAWELSGGGAKNVGKDPGWDPLEVAIAEAHKLNMELHGWINVFPIWRGAENIPAGIKHPWKDHRDWCMVDHQGKILDSTSGFYSFLSPGHPQARAYIASIFGELARNYPKLDGLHMDYVRYPSDTEASAYRVFSFDKTSVDAFKRIYGNFPGHKSPEWQKFKRDQVTQTIRQIRKAMKDESPTMELTGTFWAETSNALEQTGQDARQWLDEGIVDWVVPMSYKRNMNDLRMNLAEMVNWFGEDRKPQMILGLNVDFNTPWQINQQIQEVLDQNWGGEALFAYSSMFKNHKGNEKADVVRQIWLDEQIKDLLVSTMNSK